MNKKSIVIPTNRTWIRLKEPRIKVVWKKIIRPELHVMWRLNDPVAPIINKVISLKAIDDARAQKARIEADGAFR